MRGRVDRSASVHPLPCRPAVAIPAGSKRLSRVLPPPLSLLSITEGIVAPLLPPPPTAPSSAGSRRAPQGGCSRRGQPLGMQVLEFNPCHGVNKRLLKLSRSAHAAPHRCLFVGNWPGRPRSLHPPPPPHRGKRGLSSLFPTLAPTSRPIYVAHSGFSSHRMPPPPPLSWNPSRVGRAPTDTDHQRRAREVALQVAPSLPFRIRRCHTRIRWRGDRRPGGECDPPPHPGCGQRVLSWSPKPLRRRIEGAGAREEYELQGCGRPFPRPPPPWILPWVSCNSLREEPHPPLLVVPAVPCQWAL